MEKTILLACSFLITIHSGAQIKFSNLTASHPDSRIIYIGIENKFIIHKGSAKINDILFDGGRIQNSGNDTFSIRPAMPGKSNLTFVTQRGKQQFLFNGEHLPNFEIDLQGIDIVRGEEHHYRYVNVDTILAFGKIRILSTDTAQFFKDYKVRSCVLRIKDQEFEMKGEEIPEAALNGIAQLKKGDAIKIQYFLAGKSNLPMQNLYSPGIFTFYIR